VDCQPPDFRAALDAHREPYFASGVIAPARVTAVVGPLSHLDKNQERGSIEIMHKTFDYIVAHSAWLLPFVPLLCMVIYFAIQSRWDAYIRRMNYQELKTLHELREKGIITQEEFDEKKEELLCA
jgi:hypothetical protein